MSWLTVRGLGHERREPRRTQTGNLEKESGIW